ICTNRGSPSGFAENRCRTSRARLLNLVERQLQELHPGQGDWALDHVHLSTRGLGREGVALRAMLLEIVGGRAPTAHDETPAMAGALPSRSSQSTSGSICSAFNFSRSSSAAFDGSALLPWARRSIRRRTAISTALVVDDPDPRSGCALAEVISG